MCVCVRSRVFECTAAGHEKVGVALVPVRSRTEPSDGSPPHIVAARRTLSETVQVAHNVSFREQNRTRDAPHSYFIIKKPLALSEKFVEQDVCISSFVYNNTYCLRTDMNNS